MRLIDADAYENEMSKAYGDDWDKLHILESMPTVEQKHGHWIEKTETGRKVYCSNCKHSAPFICIVDDYYGARMHGEIKKTKCCPHCGAKMRGDNDGN